eukprot:5043411-Prymnesium_polylepis.1
MSTGRYTGAEECLPSGFKTAHGRIATQARPWRRSATLSASRHAPSQPYRTHRSPIVQSAPPTAILRAPPCHMGTPSCAAPRRALGRLHAVV